MVALHSLVAASRQLGLPSDMQLSIVEDLVRGFVANAKTLDGWSSAEEETAAEAAFNIAFLDLLIGENVETDDMVQKLLTKVSSWVHWMLTGRFHPPFQQNF